jgi:hypothetical protein
MRLHSEYAAPSPFVAGSALLARHNLLQGLRYVGRYSLAIYLAFFVPMIAVRMVLIRLGWALNVDVAAAVITIVAITGPLAAEWIARKTPFRVLFVRPRLFRILQEREVAVRSQLAAILPSARNAA